MQPPPYSPAPKKNNTVLIVVGVVLGLGICCIGPIAVLGVGGLLGFRGVEGMVKCAGSMSKIRDATVAYAKANGDTLPSAATWEDKVRPEYEKLATNQDMGPFELLSATDPWVCKNSDGTETGIAFNRDLSGKKLSDIKDRLNTALIFEVEKGGKNLNEPYKKRDDATAPKMFGQPREWIMIPVEGGDISMSTDIKVDAKAPESKE